MSDVAKIRGMLGMTQAGVADKATLTRSIISEVEGRRKGLSVAAATKASKVLGVGPGVLYLGTQLVAIKAKVDEEVITEEQAADKLLRVLRTLLEKFEDVEDEEGADELISQLEELLEQYTANSVAAVRGDKDTKPAPTATKGRGDYHPAFDVVLKYASGGSVAHDIDEGDPGQRDFFGRRLNSSRLRDDAEHSFPDPDGFGLSNEPIDDDYPTDAEPDGRDLYGRRIRPFDGGR